MRPNVKAQGRAAYGAPRWGEVLGVSLPRFLTNKQATEIFSQGAFVATLIIALALRCCVIVTNTLNGSGLTLLKSAVISDGIVLNFIGVGNVLDVRVDKCSPVSAT